MVVRSDALFANSGHICIQMGDGQGVELLEGAIKSKSVHQAYHMWTGRPVQFEGTSDSCGSAANHQAASVSHTLWFKKSSTKHIDVFNYCPN